VIMSDANCNMKMLAEAVDNEACLKGCPAHSHQAVFNKAVVMMFQQNRRFDVRSVTHWLHAASLILLLVMLFLRAMQGESDARDQAIDVLLKLNQGAIQQALVKGR
jgi:hypothetical protein